jgi:uncharacterized delta-60 repeat protein
MERLEARQLLAFYLDPSFGNQRKVTTDFGSLSDEATSVAVQSDGKIVVGGGSGVGTLGAFALSRYTTDGTLDATFGSGGKVTTNLSPVIDQLLDVAIQPDGKILAVGYAKHEGTVSNLTDFAVVRYKEDGTLDLTSPNSRPLVGCSRTLGNYFR